MRKICHSGAKYAPRNGQIRDFFGAYWTKKRRLDSPEVESNPLSFENAVITQLHSP